MINPTLIKHAILLFFIYCSVHESVAQGPFLLKQDSVGFPGREMTITEYLPDGRMLTHTRTHDNAGSMGNYGDDRREFIYYPTGDVQYDELYRRENSVADWQLFDRTEFVYDEAGNTTSYVVRGWDTNSMEWNETPDYGSFNTYNADNKILTEEFKDGSGGLAYQTIWLRHYAYYSTGELSEILHTQYSINSGGEVDYQTRDQYTWSNQNTATIARGKRNWDFGPYTPIAELTEVYELGQLVERVTSEVSNGQTLPTERFTQYYNAQGLYGGFRKENYVNGGWQLYFDNIPTFDEFGNLVSTVYSDYNEDTQNVEVSFTSDTEYDYSTLMETCMAPFSGHPTILVPFNKPLFMTQNYFENNELTDTREYVYYYSDLIVSAPQRIAPAGLVLYPNPTNDVVRFSGNYPASPLRIRILSSDGRIVKKDVIMASEPLDISGLAPGVYQCLIDINGVFTTESLVVR